MNYSTEIEAYSEGQMSAVERMAFEHELEDNTALQAEWESHQLVQDLLAEVTSQLTVEDILATENPATITAQPKAFAASTASVNSNYRPLALIALLCCTCFYYILEYGDFQEQPTIENSSKSIVVPEGIPVATQLLEKDTKKEKQKVFQEYKEEPTRKIKATSIVPTAKKVEKRRPIAMLDKSQSILNRSAKDKKELIAQSVKETNVVSKVSVKEGSELVITASESITLEAGFHATAGASFKATIGDDK